MTAHFKTREEYDQEDWERFRQKQKEIRERKAAKFHKSERGEIEGNNG